MKTTQMLEPRLQSEPDVAPWVYRRRSWLIIGLVVPLVAWPFDRAPLDGFSSAFGALALILGVALRVWSIRQIGGAARKRRHPKALRLVTWGPFALSRNPIYIANMLVFAGFGVLCGLAWLTACLLAAMWTQYHFTIRFEEHFLQSAFGKEYRAYRDRTPRWLGLFEARGAPADFAPYPWRKLVRRERSFLLVQVPLGLLIALGVQIAVR